MSREIPPKVQQLLKQLNDMQKTYQSIALQKQQLQVTLLENKNAYEAMKNSEDEYVYRLVGGVFIKVKKEDVAKELEESIKLLETRIKILEDQEKKLLEDMKKAEAEIRKLMGGGPAQVS